MRSLKRRLDAGERLLADGAMGSFLMEHGLRMGDCPEKFNLEKPELLREIARAYADAGADIVQTNTFGGSVLKLASYGLQDRTEEINRAAVAAVREAVGRGIVVSGSCGPCGRMLEPYGDATADQVRESFSRQIQALIEAGIDVLCVETMTDLNEAKLAVQAARALSAKLPIMATMTFDPTPRGFFTMMGIDVPTAAAGLIEAGADVVGSNCGNGIENMITIAREFRRATDRPLLIQANAGLPRLDGDRAVYPEDPAFMASKLPDLFAAGVQIVGGCCGTTPDHIRAFRAAIDKD